MIDGPLAHLPSSDADRRDALDAAMIRLYRLQHEPERLGRLFDRFAPLVLSSVSVHARPDESFEDVMQFALLGMLKAFDDYDPATGQGFAMFARAAINAEIVVRSAPLVGADDVRRRRKILRQQVLEARRTAPAASRTELADRLGVPLGTFLDADVPSSLRRDATPDAGGPARGEADIAFSMLGERDPASRPLRFVDAAVQSEVAQQDDASVVEVSRVLNRALDVLRTDLQARHSSAASETPDDHPLRTR